MALTASALKTLIKARVEQYFGTVGDQPNLTASEAHDQYAEAVAKAVVQWIAANGSGSVTGVESGGQTGNLTATDDL